MQPAAPQHDRAASGGLHTPGLGVGLVERPRRWTPGRILVQVIGFSIGVGLLLWCVSRAFAPANRAELAKLESAPVSLIAALLGLAMLSAVLNGVAFWATARPVHRLRVADVIAVNAIASFLAFLPFKLSLLVRVFIHRRRDGMIYKDIVAWLAAFVAFSMASLLPMIAATLIRGKIDAVWALMAGAGIVACNAAGVWLGRIASRLKWLAALSMGSWRVSRHPAPAAWTAAMKIADTAVHAARFAVVASIFEQTLAPADAALYSMIFFLIGTASPVGMLGMREGGVTLLAGAEARDQVARFALTISATEAVALAAISLLAVAWLGPRSLLRMLAPPAPPAGAAPARRAA